MSSKICTTAVLHRGILAHFCGGIHHLSVLEDLNRF